MRLSRWTMSSLVFASIVACSDTTGPERISAFFALQSVDGHPIPVVLFTEPTRTLTVVSSTVMLDKQGHAIINDSYRDDSQGVVTTPIYTTTFEYRLHGDQIEIGSFTPCAPNALCAANATGTIANGILTLNNRLAAPNGVSVYRIVPTDPV
jgi:hypothetical protein